MKTINKTCTETLREAWDGISRIASHAMRRLDRMPWPALLAACVMLALLITVLPLALTLFVLFLLVKLVAGALGGQRRDVPMHEHAMHDTMHGSGQ
ncbi:hypothetical protein IP92_00315 [Pseudoduganella flava]|uniref:DUF3742 family protein n=1 Tax=Pseudoduganella flava TaxID=871742 RepID=A0A562Q3K2_9BURK|nr:hypothetical protein [Pseudoduganella flava]QGZ41382.1 hypothetical protein GO485_21500 [Pseudoduganella flava]TWI51331.1 hypothetical protein IP92_00315 [Pseudoduganella flava]